MLLTGMRVGEIGVVFAGRILILPESLSIKEKEHCLMIYADGKKDNENNFLKDRKFCQKIPFFGETKQS